MKRRVLSVRAAAVLASALCLPLLSDAASFMEPSTVFYGKVIGTGSERPFLVKEGDLIWTIRRADGVQLVLRTELYPLNNGEYSYRLDVPHEALGLGLTDSQRTVPLSIIEDTQAHVSATVDGVTAILAGPSGATFDTDQLRRAATYRMDLLVPLTAADLDGDGIPDWWEELYGLDKQNPSDASGDPDGDGVSNRLEYLAGTNANRDDRAPVLAASAFRAYAEGTTGLRLAAVDVDSTPDQLTYTLETVPASGAILLRNAGGSAGNDAVLNAGAVFTQADVLNGRVIYRHGSPDDGAGSTAFDVTLRDEDSQHAASMHTVRLALYRPPYEDPGSELDAAILSNEQGIPSVEGVALADQQTELNYILSRYMGRIIWDGSGEMLDMTVGMPSTGLSDQEYLEQYLPLHGAECRHVLCGGLGDDYLQGGMESDIIVGGLGSDRIAGHGGADLFVLRMPADGNDTIEDFSLAENDAIDVSAVLTGASRNLKDYLDISSDGTNSVLLISGGGTLDAGADLVMTVCGTEIADADIYDLIDSNSLRVGDKVLPPYVEIFVKCGPASESGSIPGTMEIRRRGDSAPALTLSLQVSGSAQNGVDYEMLSYTVSLAKGQKSATVSVVPYPDTITELQEVVAVKILPGAGYTVGASHTASVGIQDMLPLVTVEALEPVAVQQPARPGVFLIRRSAVIDRSLFVLLRFTGTAVNGKDYEYMSGYVNLGPSQTAATITVTPRSGVDLSGGAKSVDLTILPDPSYVMPPESSSARVFMVAEEIDFQEWKDRNFPDATEPAAEFAAADFGNEGVVNIVRYAFGLDAQDPKASTGLPVYAIRDNHLTVMFRQPASAMGVTYIVEVSDDLVVWHSGDQHIERIPVAPSVTDPEMVCYMSKATVDLRDLQYMRVRISYTP